MSKIIVVIETSKIREILNESSCSFGTILHIVHTQLTIRCRMPDRLKNALELANSEMNALSMTL